MTATEHKSDFKLTTDTPYLALTGELWVSIMIILKKIDRVITAPHCTWFVHHTHAAIFLCYYGNCASA